MMKGSTQHEEQNSFEFHDSKWQEFLGIAIVIHKIFINSYKN